MDDWLCVGTAAGTALRAGVDGRVGADLCRRIGKQKQQKDFGGELVSEDFGGKHWDSSDDSIDLEGGFLASADFEWKLVLESTDFEWELVFELTDFEEKLFDSTDFRVEVSSSACRMTRCFLPRGVSLQGRTSTERCWRKSFQLCGRQKENAACLRAP